MVNKKRSNFKFSTLGISIGHTIVFTEYFNSDGTPITAVVVDDKNVLFRSTIQRLTPATLILLPHKKTTRPGRYWEYKGDKLIDLYEKNYPKPKGRLVMPVLDWIGKQAVVNHHKEVPYKLLHCDSSLSVGDPDSGNLIVEGDNLEALKALLPYYKGQVDCIFIDPPYNTGNENWSYNDNVNSPEIREWLGNAVGKEKDDLSRHDKWLCMMYPRLLLLHQLLAEKGVIIIHIDDNELHNLCSLMNEIFMRKNFVATIAVVANLKGNQDQFGFAGCHEYVVLFAKNRINCSVNEFKLDEDESKKWHEDEHGPYKIGANLKATGTNAPREKRPNLFFPIYVSELGDVSCEKPSNNLQWEKILPTTNGREVSWRWEKDKFEKELHNVIVTRAKDGISLKKKQRPKDGETPSKKAKSVFYKPEYSTSTAATEIKDFFGYKKFDTPKPLRLLEDFVEICSRKDSIILDSFAGSGTTAHAVLKANAEDGGNRKFILVEMIKDIAQGVTASRLTDVINGYNKKNDQQTTVAGLGGGFRYCQLGTTLFNEYGDINQEVSFPDLAAHIFFSETGLPLPKKVDGSTPIIGQHKDKIVYLLFSQADQGFPREAAGNILTPDMLASLPLPPDDFEGKRIVYAEGCTASDDRLNAAHIIFKHIPYHIEGA